MLWRDGAFCPANEKSHAPFQPIGLGPSSCQKLLSCFLNAQCWRCSAEPPGLARESSHSASSEFWEFARLLHGAELRFSGVGLQAGEGLILGLSKF